MESDLHAHICDALHDLVPFSTTFSKVAGLWKISMKECYFAKINTPPWVFFMFLKLHKYYQIAQSITYYKYPFLAFTTSSIVVLKTICRINLTLWWKYRDEWIKYLKLFHFCN